jgi:hypothetical protein
MKYIIVDIANNSVLQDCDGKVKIFDTFAEAQKDCRGNEYIYTHYKNVTPNVDEMDKSSLEKLKYQVRKHLKSLLPPKK